MWTLSHSQDIFVCLCSFILNNVMNIITPCGKSSRKRLAVWAAKGEKTSLLKYICAWRQTSQRQANTYGKTMYDYMFFSCSCWNPMVKSLRDSTQLTRKIFRKRLLSFSASEQFCLNWEVSKFISTEVPHWEPQQVQIKQRLHGPIRAHRTEFVSHLVSPQSLS